MVEKGESVANLVADGSVYVATTSVTSAGTDRREWLVSLDRDGNQQWTFHPKSNGSKPAVKSKASQLETATGTTGECTHRAMQCTPSDSAQAEQLFGPSSSSVASSSSSGSSFPRLMSMTVS